MSASVGSPQDEQHCFKSHVYRGVPWGPFIFLTQTDLIDYVSVACDNKQGDLQYYISCKYDMGNYLTQGITQQIADWREGRGWRREKFKESVRYNEKILTVSEACMAIFSPIPNFTEIIFNSSRFLKEGTLICSSPW